MMALKTEPYDTADYLNSTEASAAYIEAAFEVRDPALITRALGVVRGRQACLSLPATSA